VKWHFLHYDPRPMLRGTYRFEKCVRAGCDRRRTTVRYWPAEPHNRPDFPQPASHAGQILTTSGWRRPPESVWPAPDPVIEEEWVKFVARTYWSDL
jgi:hypothetical protein